MRFKGWQYWTHSWQSIPYRALRSRYRQLYLSVIFIKIKKKNKVKTIIYLFLAFIQASCQMLAGSIHIFLIIFESVNFDLNVHSGLQCFHNSFFFFYRRIVILLSSKVNLVRLVSYQAVRDLLKSIVIMRRRKNVAYKNIIFVWVLLNCMCYLSYMIVIWLDFFCIVYENKMSFT